MKKIKLIIVLALALFACKNETKTEQNLTMPMMVLSP
jgi:hypothetical protein